VSEAIAQKQPRALYYLFFAEAWERFSFYGMRALLVLYLTEAFAFGDKRAYLLYGSYTALVYTTPVIGGLLADRLLGFRKAVTLGAVLMALGHFAMAVENLQVLYFALALLICGNGFFKPNISSMVGRLYETDDPRRDAGFTIFYMGINLGAMFAPVTCAYLGHRFGWHWGFGLAGVGMVLGLLVFLRARPLLEGLAEPPDAPYLRRPALAGLSREVWVYVGSAAAVGVAWQLVQYSALLGRLLIGVGLIVAVGLLVMLSRLRDPGERRRMSVALVLIVFSIVFWAFFEQAGTSMSLFTSRNVNRSLFGHVIDAEAFQAVNPAIILLLAPVFGALWLYLARRAREPSTPLKFALGIFQVGLGFVALYIGAVTSRATGHVPMFWLVLGYLLHTTGELCLSPIGLSMITKLSPPSAVGIMMGTWFLSSAFAQYVASLIASLTAVTGDGPGANIVPPPTETVMVYGHVFGNIALVALAVGLLLVGLAPALARRMRAVG